MLKHKHVLLNRIDMILNDADTMRWCLQEKSYETADIKQELIADLRAALQAIQESHYILSAILDKEQCD